MASLPISLPQLPRETLEPFNFAIPVLGVIDDLFLLPWLLHGLAKIAAYAVRLHTTSQSHDDRVVSVH